MTGARASRILPAEQVALHGVQAIAARPVPHRVRGRLGPEDLDNEAAQAAYALGRRRGYEAGLRAGRAQGDDEARARFEASAAARIAAGAQGLQAQVERFAEQLAATEHELAQALLALALDLARAVVRRECASAADALLPAVQEAAAVLASTAARARVRVHPQDAPALQGALERLDAAAPAGAFDVVADASLAAGACIVEGDSARVDAGLQARWDAAVCALGLDPQEAPWTRQAHTTR